MPGALLRALSEYKFVGTPLWKMSDGKDLVRVELTFHKKLPTPRYYKKAAESRRQPATPAGVHPCCRVASPARFSYKTAATPSTDADKEGDATTTDTDYTTDTASDHQTTLQEYSYHHRIADHHQTSTSTSVSRDTAFEESQKRVSSTSARSLDPILLIPLRRRVPDSREIRLLGRSQQQASWKRCCNHKGTKNTR